jgi:hypothetical protein
MTLDPAQADATSVITVIISLSNYPAVFMSQNINVKVDGSKIAATVTEDKTTSKQNITVTADGSKTAATVTEDKTTSKPCIPPQILGATINKEVFLELPALPETSYSVTSKQEFEATLDANVLKVLSTSESDVGTKSLWVSLNSPTLNCISQVKI